MERNVHASKCPTSAQRELTFIFPNYIHEPLLYFERSKFSSNALIIPLINELYNIVENSLKTRDEQQNWREKLVLWLKMSNKTLPQISNQCSSNASMRYIEKGQQVTDVSVRKKTGSVGALSATPSLHSPSLSFSSADSSAILSSSSCITCSSFEGADIREVPIKKDDSLVELIKAKTAPLAAISSLIEDQQSYTCEEAVEEILVEEEELSQLQEEEEVVQLKEEEEVVRLQEEEEVVRLQEEEGVVRLQEEEEVIEWQEIVDENPQAPIVTDIEYETEIANTEDLKSHHSDVEAPNVVNATLSSVSIAAAETVANIAEEVNDEQVPQEFPIEPISTDANLSENETVANAMETVDITESAI